MACYVDLAPVPDRPAQFRGRVCGHPEPTTTLETTRIGDDTRAVRLTYAPHEDCAPVPLGEGVMTRQADGSWTGYVTEFGGRWLLTAERGGARVTFVEGEGGA